MDLIVDLVDEVMQSEIIRVMLKMMLAQDEDSCMHKMFKK